MAPDHVAERDCRADTPESHAGNPDYRRRARRLDACALGRSQGDAAAVANDALMIVARGEANEDPAAA